MRVLVISPAFPPMKSGGADYVQRLCEELVQGGLDVHCITSKGSYEGVRGFQLHSLVEDWNWTAAPQLLKTIGRIKPDVVDLHFTGWIYHEQPMITFLPTAIKRFMPGTKVIMHLESLGGIKTGSPADRLVRYIVSCWAGRDNIDYEYGSTVRDCDAVVVLNSRDARMLKERFPELGNKYTLIPPPPIMPIDKSGQRAQWRSELKVEPDTVLLSYFGYAYPGKGVETLIEALSKVGNEKQYKLIIAGEMPDSYAMERLNQPRYIDVLKEMAARLSVAELIHWSGYLPSDSTRASQLLQASDICVLPYERGVLLNNSSFSYAAAHGLPIITTKGADSEDVFEHGVNVYFSPPSNSDALAQAIKDLAGDATLQKRISRGALDLCQEWFSWPAALDKTLELFGASQEKHKTETHA